MHSSRTERASLIAKRLILGLLGLAALAPLGLAVVDLVRHPDGRGVAALLIMLLGAPAGPFLLTRWSRWPRIKSGNRIGAMFFSAYLGPIALLVLARFEHVEGAVFVVGPLAIGITALWWSWSGYRLDEPPPSAPPD